MLWESARSPPTPTRGPGSLATNSFTHVPEPAAIHRWNKTLAWNHNPSRDPGARRVACLRDPVGTIGELLRAPSFTSISDDGDWSHNDLSLDTPRRASTPGRVFNPSTTQWPADTPSGTEIGRPQVRDNSRQLSSPLPDWTTTLSETQQA